MRYAHDLVNVSLGKKMYAPEAVKEWEPYARKLASQLETVHQNQTRTRRPAKCRFNIDTFRTNPDSVTRFMKDLVKAQKSGDAEAFVDELNGLCSTVQPRLVLSQEDPVKISGKCSGNECSLTAITGGKTLEKEPRIKIPIRGYTQEAFTRAVDDARAQLRETRGGRAPSAPTVTKPKKPRGKYEIPTFAQLDGERLSLTLKVVPIKDVHPSNDPLTFEINPDYPGFLQPRDRTRMTNVVQVRTMAASLNPLQVVDDFRSLDRGAPVVWGGGGEGYFVISGNGRAMAIKLAYLNHPEVFAEYEKAIKVAYPDFGVGVSDAMLVREISRDTKRDRLREIAELGNVATAIATSPEEMAAIDSAKMNAEFVGRLQPFETLSFEETIQAAGNRGWVTQFIALVPETERPAMQDAKGKLTRTGTTRIALALAIWTFGFEEGQHIAALLESVDNDAKNIVQGTMRVVPAFGVMLSRLQGFVDNASPQTMDQAVLTSEELNITPTIAKAISDYMEIKRSGITLEDRLQQAGFGGMDTDFSPLEIELLRMFERNKRSAAAITKFFTAYVETANQVPNPNQAGMWEDDFYKIEEGDSIKSIQAITRGESSAQRPLIDQFQCGARTVCSNNHRRLLHDNRRKNKTLSAQMFRSIATATGIF